jgi:hypothetical protein
LGIINEFPVDNGSEVADLNEDGTINSIDYTLMRRKLLGDN